jgi:AraC-like DNA-binding protein
MPVGGSVAPCLRLRGRRRCPDGRGTHGGRVQPVDVHLSRRAPEPGSPHARLLKCQSSSTAAQLPDPRPRGDEDAAGEPRSGGAARFDGPNGGAYGRGGRTRGQVRRAIRRALLEEAPKMPEIAHDLGIHPRTLRRRLSEEGTTFDDLLDDVRQTVARELIELTDMPLGEIGDALAFASPGVFSQWFRRAFGMPPSLWPRQPHRWTAESERPRGCAGPFGRVSAGPRPAAAGGSRTARGRPRSALRARR